jgi:hypothetical protein
LHQTKKPSHAPGSPVWRVEVRIISPSRRRRARGQRFVKEPTKPTKVIPSVLSAMTVEPLSTLTAPDLIHCLMSLLTFLCGANARVSPPGPDRDMARVPDAACIEHVGLRLFSVSRPSCSRRFTLLRHPAREQGDLPHRSDAASDGRLGRAANRGMLRLGSSATAILDSRSRQPLWRELRSSRAGARNTASSYAVQVASNQCRR